MTVLLTPVIKHAFASTSLQRLPLAKDLSHRDRWISGLIAVAVHGAFLIGGEAMLASGVEYGVEAGDGGMAVHLVAALPASSVRLETVAVAPAVPVVPAESAQAPVPELPSVLDPLPAPLAVSDPQPQEGGAAQQQAAASSASTVINSTPFVGDESSPVPGKDATTLHSSGGARGSTGPKYFRNPAPPYPSLAREQGYEGTVLLRVEVLPNGRCGELEIAASSGHAILDEAAANAVKRWRFKPAHRAFKPAAAWVKIPVTFRLVDLR